MSNMSNMSNTFNIDLFNIFNQNINQPFIKKYELITNLINNDITINILKIFILAHQEFNEFNNIIQIIEYLNDNENKCVINNINILDNINILENKNNERDKYKNKKFINYIKDFYILNKKMIYTNIYI